MTHKWEEVRLGEVIREERQPVGTFDGDQLPVLGVTNTAGIIDTGVRPSEDRSRYLRLRPGRFAYNPYRVNVGSIGLATSTQDGIVSPAYVVFAPSEKIDARFLHFFLKSARGGQLINFHGNRGSVRSALRFDDLSKIPIPLPPLPEQRRIVARIAGLAAQIVEARNLRSQAQAHVRRLRAASFEAAIGDCPADEIALEDACELIIDNLHSNPRYSPAGVPCVRSPDVGWGVLDLDSALRTDETEYTHRIARGAPQADDIVFVREGGGTGKCALVLGGQRFSLGQRVMMIRPNQRRVVPKFFLYQLLSPLVQERQILPLCKGSASPHLNIGALRHFQFRLPHLAEQRGIVATLDALSLHLAMLTRVQTETGDALDALLPAILDRAFKGEM